MSKTRNGFTSFFLTLLNIVIVLIVLGVGLLNTAWGFWTGDDFNRFSLLHSYFNLHYRFYRNHPSESEINVIGNIPYGVLLESTKTKLTETVYSWQTTLGYSAILRGIDRHRYRIGQSWYGDFLHVKFGYGFTHRVNPVAAFKHEFPLSLGGFISGWEIQLFGSLNWHPTTFSSLWGGQIAYYFNHLEPLSREDFANSRKDFFPHRVEIKVYQVSPLSFGIRNTYAFNVWSSMLTSSHLRLLFSWEIFPLKVGIAVSFIWKDWGQATSYTLYHPEWGVNQSFELGVKNYRTFWYGNQIKDPLRTIEEWE